MEVPTELRYGSSHEWCLIEGDIATVGITDFAQSQLGDIVYVELPVVGSIIDGAGEPFGTIESVKAAEDLKAPVSGEIIEVHDEIEQMIEQINLDPYGQGWLIRVRMAEPSEAKGLLDADAYVALCESEG